MIYLHVNLQGDIRGFSTAEPDHEDPLLKYIAVTDEYEDFAKDLMIGRKSMNLYKVNLESAQLKIYEKNGLTESDPTFDRFLNVPFISAKTTILTDLLFSFVSKDHKLYVNLKYYGSRDYIKSLRQHSIKFHVTGKNDIHKHHETFYFNFDDFNSDYEIERPVVETDPELIYSNAISVYARKLFKHMNYTIL
jgi:hypothetical protein